MSAPKNLLHNFLIYVILATQLREVIIINTDCIFCKIVRKEVSSQIVYEDDYAIAFSDIQPQAPVHLLVIPKEHLESMNDVTAEKAELMSHLMKVISEVAENQGVAESGYRVITNSGKDSGQLVNHLHFHLLGGRPLKGLG